MGRIKRITVKKSGLFASFLDYREYIAQYGIGAINCSRTREQIAIDDNVFLRVLNQEFGFYGLPENNTNSQFGIDQDGSTFQNNFYSERQLLWQFEWFENTSSNLDTVTYQNDELLEIEFETENGVYYSTRCSLVGRLEGGTAEFLSHSAYWSVRGGNTIGCQVIPLESSEIILIDEANVNGFYVNDIYFGDSVNSNLIILSTPIFASPIYTISGVWQDMLVTNTTTGSSLLITASCLDECVIDTVEQTVVIDGVDYTALVRGIYPTLASGSNRLVFQFGARTTDVEVCWNYPEQVGSPL